MLMRGINAFCELASPELQAAVYEDQAKEVRRTAPV